MPTAHIEAKKGEIAKTVLMPGDPLRAKFIADTFLENVKQFNNVRGMMGFTGTYKGKEVSVMGSGMGMPSIGIYSFELFTEYEVDNIIRIGSCGAYTDALNLYDVILVDSAWSESTFAEIVLGEKTNTLEASEGFNDVAREVAKEQGIEITECRIHSSDVFYRKNYDDYISIRDNHNALAVEMESFALFANAKATGKNGACILTVSDNLVTHEATSSEERQNAFTKMMELALNTAVKL